MTISRELADFMVETKLSDIPEETIEFTKGLILKTVAGMLGGSLTAAGRKISSLIKSRGGPQEAVVVGCGFRAPIDSAVLANGLFAHAAELEDDQFPSATSDINIIPVILPLADKLRMTGGEFVEAAAVSIEVMNRVGMFSLTHLGMTDLPFYGVLGSAAAASKVLGLSPGQIHSALGIAIGRAGGFIVNFGTDAHFLESAMACRDGLEAAILAREGMSGNADFEKWLSGLLGEENVDLGKITDNLGKPDWHVHHIWIKKYPCCFLTHRQNDATFSILEKHALSNDDIEKVDIHVGPIDATCNRPNPKDPEDARFSFQHIQAAILLERKLDFDSFTNGKIADRLFAEARAKVKVHTHPDWEKKWMSGPGKVTVTTKDGKTYTEERDQPLGGPKYPLSREQFEELYRKYSRESLTEEQIKYTSEIILNLERVKDLQKFMQVLTFRGEP